MFPAKKIITITIFILALQAVTLFYFVFNHIGSALRQLLPVIWSCFLILLSIIIIPFLRRNIRQSDKSNKNEQLFSHLLNAAPDATIVINEQGQIQMTNRQAENLFGYKSTELIGQPVEILIPAEWRQKHFHHRQEYMSSARVREMGSGLELKALQKTGNKFPVEISLSPIQTDDGMLISAAIRDISKRKNEEEKLKKSEKNFQLLVGSVKDYAIFLIDTEGKVNTWNSGAEHIKGYTAEEITGQPIDIFYTAEDRHNEIPAYNLKKARENGRYESEGWRLRKDGTAFYADVLITALFDSDGNLYGYAKVTKDITERKQLENELKKANSELEAFTYSVSHDLRAPLRGIIGFTTILEEEYGPRLDEEAMRITGVIKDNTIKMGHLIDGLLAFSRMNKQELIKVPVQTTKLVNSVIQEVMGQYKGLEVEWELGELGNANADINSIRQVWINLISNAVKYSAHKKPAIISITSKEEEGQLCFSVKDNGVGFDDRYKHKLFKVFQRLHDETDFEGTGIGLALAEKIITKHGGKVWASGQLNKGACFSFSLPL